MKCLRGVLKRKKGKKLNRVYIIKKCMKNYKISHNGVDFVIKKRVMFDLLDRGVK